jgi:hypothetical protein
MNNSDIEQTITSCLQRGINPFHSDMSSYCLLAVTRIRDDRYHLQPIDMKGSKVHYKYLKQTVGSQALVSTLKTLSAKHRIHKENYSFNDLQQTDDDIN